MRHRKDQLQGWGRIFIAEGPKVTHAMILRVAKGKENLATHIPTFLKLSRSITSSLQWRLVERRDPMRHLIEPYRVIPSMNHSIS